MAVVAGIDGLGPGRRVATLGVFDGVHRGHRAALHATVATAGEEAARAVVVTFDPHPAAVLRGEAPPLLLDPAESRARMLALGIDDVVVQPFDRDFASLLPEEFLVRLGAGGDLRAMVMGEGAAFGRGRSGTTEVVAEIGARLGFRLVIVPVLRVGGERVSSGLIRALVERGRLTQAARLLGRRHAVTGTVVRGDGRGRDLGYPTANLAFEQAVTLPPEGVYAVRVSWGGPDPVAPTRYADGVASLGVRPTFGDGDRALEVYLFDFDEDLYGQRLRLELVRRQRGQRQFVRIAALRRQMDRDAARAREILARAAA